MDHVGTMFESDDSSRHLHDLCLDPRRRVQQMHVSAARLHDLKVLILSTYMFKHVNFAAAAVTAGCSQYWRLQKTGQRARATANVQRKVIGSLARICEFRAFKTVTKGQGGVTMMASSKHICRSQVCKSCVCLHDDARHDDHGNAPTIALQG